MHSVGRKDWLKEAARDLIAFGSLPFLIITIVRVSVEQAYYLAQFLIAAALFFILRVVFKGDLRAGVGFILLAFTSFFYRHPLFVIFALLIYIGLIVSLFYLKRDRKEILKGLFLGGISTAISYSIVKLIFF